MDLIFFIYYSLKASHKWKAIYCYLPHIRRAFDEFIEYAKGPEILDHNDFPAWQPIPHSFKSFTEPPKVIMELQTKYFEHWKAYVDLIEMKKKSGIRKI